ncbi:septum formation initiator family protein [Microbacterium betulae]|uniref:Septum formation initiator family protein n=1 Tax=Microbacterium betulae TaxID=2981139 RepID=A0AA97I6Z2_9MICO|nr:septum formation initiator family protein [Microbacterium sp. AB]WOF24359.1 septum formation initiator family protein [Microbacterium sp. AB]
MAKRPTAPPSAVRGRRSSDGGGRREDVPRVDVRDWLGGIRLSGFTVIVLCLVVLGAFVLVPTASTYLDQRQRIAALQDAVQLGQEEVAALERERTRWQDPAYIATQARERLYYVKPGEVVYLVDNDLEETELPREPEPVSSEVEEAESDWMGQLLRSVVASGLAETAVPEQVPDGDGVFQPDSSTDQ